MSHSSTLMSPLPPLSTGNNSSVLLICESTSFAAFISFLYFYTPHISDIIQYWSFTISLIPLSIMFAAYGKILFSFKAAWILMVVFSWGVRGFMFTQGLILKEVFCLEGQGWRGRFTMHGGLKYGNKSLFPWQPRETDHFWHEGEHSSEEHVWDQLGFRQLKRLTKRKLSSLWSDAPCRGYIILGTCSTPRDTWKGHSGLQSGDQARSAAHAHQPQAHSWLEDKHKATLFPGPDL